MLCYMNPTGGALSKREGLLLSAGIFRVFVGFHCNKLVNRSLEIFRATLGLRADYGLATGGLHFICRGTTLTPPPCPC